DPFEIHCGRGGGRTEPHACGEGEGVQQSAHVTPPCSPVRRAGGVARLLAPSPDKGRPRLRHFSIAITLARGIRSTTWFSSATFLSLTKTPSGPTRRLLSR